MTMETHHKDGGGGGETCFGTSAMSLTRFCRQTVQAIASRRTTANAMLILAMCNPKYHGTSPTLIIIVRVQ